MPTARRSRRSGKVRPPEDGCWPPKKSTSTSPEKLPRNTSGSVTSRPSRVWRMVPPTALAGASESTNCGTSLLLTRAFVKKPFTSTRPVTSTVRFATGAGAGGEGGVCAASGTATAASETSNVARISGSWRFRYDYSKLQRLERNREQAMRWIPLLLGVGWITAVQPGVAQGRVAGRVTLLEKGGKSPPDLGAAVVYLEGGGADGSFEIAPVPSGTWVVHAWHERSREVSQAVNVTTAGAAGIALQLDARGFRWTPHKNKYGKDYPT